MTTKILIDRELLERIDESAICDGTDTTISNDLFTQLVSALAAPRQPEGEGLEVVAWANPEDILQDGYSHSFGVSSEQYPGREPLCRLSDAQRAIAELQAEIDTLRQQRESGRYGSLPYFREGHG